MILVFYSEQGYREVVLPKVDNQDYEVILGAEEYHLKKTISIRLDVVDGVWRILRSREYRATYQGANAAERPLKAGQLIRMETLYREQLVILVLESTEELTAYKKYTIKSNLVRIGAGQENDIIYSYQDLVSTQHAEIAFSDDRAVIRDNSRNGSFLNRQKINGATALSFGDRISIFGLTVIYLGRILAVSGVGAGVTVRLGRLQEWEPLLSEKAITKNETTVSSEKTIHISPRVIPKLYRDKEEIENVPQKRDIDKRPAWMSILPSLTMVLPMMLGYSLMGRNMGMGIVISAGSAIVGVTWGIINLRYNRQEIRKAERLRLKKYEEYLVERADRIRGEYEFNENAMREMYPEAEACGLFTESTPELWARKTSHQDFLFLRLGLGETPFQVEIATSKPGFTLEEDELAERPRKIASSFKMLKNVPLGINLAEDTVVGLLTDHEPEKAVNLMRVIVSQIVANHSYMDVKLAVLYDGNGKYAENWNQLRWLPHIWNEERNFRYIASDPNGISEVLYALLQILRKRQEDLNEEGTRKTEAFYPHYVLIVEDPAMLESQIISRYLFEEGKELGITTVLMADSYDVLPSTCSLVVENTARFQGINHMAEEGSEKEAVVFDGMSEESMAALSKRLSSYRVHQAEANRDIPDSLTYFEMAGIHRLTDLNALERWKKNRIYESMKAMVGWKAGNQPCYLDIHEKYHGPHGLVAGTTGSGKSETLQTYILSLAVNFSPLDVGLFIIDFKGGGMANLFDNLPHTIGSISNLSGNQVHRAMVSIKSENLRRQRIFSEHGVNHIDAYMKLFKNGDAAEPIPHMLIIIDEFAELKREEPDFMRELISVAQVGRSLGVHLILATQKPSGTVDDNIWSNTKFKLCLRVADKQDSNDMLHRPDAAYLTRAGRCYLQVGNNEIFELFQSGWSGAKYQEGGEDARSSAVMLDLQGQEAVPLSVIAKKQKTEPEGKTITQLDAIVGYLADVARESGLINTQKLWMPVLPEKITLKELPGYSESVWLNNPAWKEDPDFHLAAYIGKADDPERQAQYPIQIDLAAHGHMTVVGGVTSGKSTFLQSLVYSLMTTCTPEEVNFYMVDFSSQLLLPFEDSPHVGGVVLEGENDRLQKLFGLIAKILAERKQQIRGGSFGQYIRLHGKTLPAIVVIIDGYANFREKTEEAFEDILLELSRTAESYGIYLVISCAGFGSGELQSKIADNMRQSICLELGDKFRYGEALRTMHFDVLPEENVKGRGLTLVDGRVLEYQTALSMDAENDFARSEEIKTLCQEMKKAWTGRRARRIPEIPEKPTWEGFLELTDMRSILSGGRLLPLAWKQEDASVFSMDMSRSYRFTAFGAERSGKSTFLRNAACAARMMSDQVFVIDTPAQQDMRTAECCGAEYASDPQKTAEVVRKMILITNERAPLRKELLAQGYDDEEIFTEMQKKYPPVFFIISNMYEFLKDMYTNQPGIGQLSPWIESIFEKGQLLNVFFITAINISQIAMMSDKPAWYSFIKGHDGVVLGGEVTRQSVLKYTNLSYKEQIKKLKIGYAYATNPEDNQIMDMIVIPQNRGVTRE